MNKEKIVEDLVKRYENLKFKIVEPVLDIGGGDGLFLESQGVRDALIVDATNNKNPRYRYLVADISKRLPRLNIKFKTIFLTETLEHLKNPLYLLAQVYDLLDDNGYCYISVPYTEIAPDHHHVCRWKLKEIVSQTKKLGFIPRVLQKRRRFKGLAVWLPHCWIVLSLKKRLENTNIKNKEIFNMEV